MTEVSLREEMSVIIQLVVKASRNISHLKKEQDNIAVELEEDRIQRLLDQFDLKRNQLALLTRPTSEISTNKKSN